MTEPNVILIKRVNKRIEEFLDDQDPQNFSSIGEMMQAFSRWLMAKEAGKQTGAPSS